MNNLLLGGAGFIGQHLAHHLLKTRQARVTIIDNLSTSRINLEEFAQYKNLFEFIEADLSQIGNEEFMKIGRKSHRVFHLAGSVGVEYIDKHPTETLFNNINLSTKLVPLLTQLKRPVLFTSTSEVYGNGPFAEDGEAHIGPTNKLRWGYASAKLTSEFMIRASSFPSTIVRLFNVVGPGQLGDYGMVLPRFVQAAKNNQPLIVYGDGSQVRSFCHIDDAIVGLLKVFEVPNETFNIGNEQPVTIKRLAERVIELSGSSSTIEYVPYAQAFSNQHSDINRRVPDLTKIKALTGYVPMYNLDDIITDMLA